MLLRVTLSKLINVKTLCRKGNIFSIILDKSQANLCPLYEINDPKFIA